jgi:stage II sporulation protein D
LTALALPARSASPQFRVELFSNRIVKALTLEGREQSIRICGAKTDGPCFVLPSNMQLSCLADVDVQCRLGEKDRRFTLVTASAPMPFRIALTFLKTNEAPQAFLLRNVRIAPNGTGLQVSTELDLESYVSGVLRGEASVMQTPAARQAMAIVARTWALRWQGRHRAAGFDFCCLTHCQAFRLPQEANAHAADDLEAAARATRGQILLYHGALADPYFTACCGGATEAAGNVWPDRAQPYLISIHDPYCLSSPHASWKNAIAAENVQRALREALHLPLTGPPAQLSVEKCDSSGRALILRVVGNATWNIDANQFRYAVDRRLGWQQIKSNFYRIEHQGDSWVFVGRGLGHGVGLCQAGAEQMARLGASPEKILSTYFPGTEIARQRADDPDPIASSEHFELVYPVSQEPWVKQTLDALEQAREALGAHAEVLPSRVRVATWGSVGEFIRGTGQPGWMAASSDGNSIALQPLELLARKRILDQTVRHELTHLVVHRLRAQGVPGWFEEGLVLYLTGERIDAPVRTLIPTSQLEHAITQPRSEAEMKTAYAQALERVQRLARQQGEPDLWRTLQSPSKTHGR